MIEILENVADVFNTDGEANKFRRYTGCCLLFYGQLLVSGRRWMNYQRLGVTNVGNQREQLQRIDQFLASFISTLDAEGDECTLAIGQILLCACMVRAGLKARIVDPIDTGMLLEMTGNSKRILGVALEP